MGVLRLLADENFNGDVVRGLWLSVADADVVRVQDMGLSGFGDAHILAWAAQQGRIVMTHDRATMPAYAYDRIAAGEEFGGMFVINDRFPSRLAIREIQLMAACSLQAEWQNRVVYLPL